MATAHDTSGPRRRYRNRLEQYRFYARLKLAPSHAADAVPLPDEPEFNEETKQAIRDTRAGIGLTRYESVDDFFAAHGI